MKRQASERTIPLRGRTITYTLRRNARAKRIRLTIHPGGTLTVTLPLRASELLAERFMHEKANWLLDQLDRSMQRGVGAFAHYGREHFLEHRAAARKLAHERLAHFSRLYGFGHGAVSIRDQKTRWGSCSRSGNLSFNYKLAVVPEHVADYIVVHELCHCKEFNHSKAFWDLVARAIPNHREIRKELRTL